MVYEVEQKFRVPNVAELTAKLAALGVKLGPPVEQIDRYFNHPGRDFAVTDEALRLRTVGTVNRITYKGPRHENAVKTRREMELPLGDGNEALLGFAELLQALGFTAVREVRKWRRSAAWTWQGAVVEIALDEVDGLGNYVELEQTAGADEVAWAQGQIEALAAELGLNLPETRSYLELLLASNSTA